MERVLTHQLFAMICPIARQMLASMELVCTLRSFVKRTTCVKLHLAIQETAHVLFFLSSAMMEIIARLTLAQTAYAATFLDVHPGAVV